MKSIFYTLLFGILITACNNDGKEKKAAEKDSAAIVEDTSAQITEVAPLNLDSITSSEPAAAGTEAVRLAFSLPAGKAYSFNSTIDINQEMPGQRMNSKMSYKYVLRVTKAEKDSRKLTATYGEMAMDMDMNGRKMSFNSNSGQEGPMNPLNMIGRMFSAMKGKSFTMNVSPEGEITRVDGFEELADAVIIELKIPEANRETFTRNFKTQFNENSVKKMFSESFNIFPPKPVKPGDSWKKTASLPQDNEAITTYTLKEKKGNNYVIDAKTIYQSKGNKPVIGTSRLLVDANTGLVIQMDSEQKMEGSKAVISRSRVRSKEI
jgi:hypothetical protein